MASTYSAVGYGTPVSGFVPNGALTPALPNGVVAGNLLLLHTTTFLGTFNPPVVSGWTWLTTDFPNRSIGLYGRIATGSGDAPSVDWGSSNMVFAAAMTAAYTGNPNTVMQIIHTDNNRASNSTDHLTYTGLVITQPNCLVVCGGTLNLDNTTNEAGAAFGTLTNFTTQSFSAPNNGQPATVFNDWIQTTPTTFSLPTQSFSPAQATAQSYVTYSVALKPGGLDRFLGGACL